MPDESKGVDYPALHQAAVATEAFVTGVWTFGAEYVLLGHDVVTSLIVAGVVSVGSGVAVDLGSKAAKGINNWLHGK